MELEVDEMKIKMEKGAVADSRAAYGTGDNAGAASPVTAATTDRTASRSGSEEGSGDSRRRRLSAPITMPAPGGTPFVEIGTQGEKGGCPVYHRSHEGHE